MKDVPVEFPDGFWLTLRFANGKIPFDAFVIQSLCSQLADLPLNAVVGYLEFYAANAPIA